MCLKSKKYFTLFGILLTSVLATISAIKNRIDSLEFLELNSLKKSELMIIKPVKLDTTNR